MFTRLTACTFCAVLDFGLHMDGQHRLLQTDDEIYVKRVSAA